MKAIVFFADISYLVKLRSNNYTTLKLENLENISNFEGWGPTLVVYEKEYLYLKKISFNAWDGNRSSSSQMFFKIGVLKNFKILTIKHLRWGLFQECCMPKAWDFINKRLHPGCFPVNIAKFLRAAFLYRTPPAFVLILMKIPAKIMKGFLWENFEYYMNIEYYKIIRLCNNRNIQKITNKQHYCKFSNKFQPNIIILKQWKNYRKVNSH